MTRKEISVGTEPLEARRLLAGGRLDPTFGQILREMALPPQLEYNGMRGSDFVRLSDGKVVVAGDAFSDPVHYGYFALARFNVDGSLDRTFGENGLAANPAAREYFEGASPSVAVDTNGRFLVAELVSEEFLGRIRIARFHADGRIDTTLDGDGDGVVEFPLNAEFGAIADMIVDESGRVLLCGNYSRYEPSPDFSFIARLTPSLSLDSTFGVRGVREIDASPFTESLQALARGNDGKITAVGSVYDKSRQNILVVRLSASGNLDRTFDQNGLATVDGLTANALSVDSNGRVVVAGWDSFQADPSTSSRMTTITLRRFNSNGSLDSAFGGTLQQMGINGALTQLPAGIEFLTKHRMALRPRATGGFELAALQAEYRFTAYGRPDRSFDGDGKRALQIADPVYGPTAFVFEPNGTLLRLQSGPDNYYYAANQPFEVFRYSAGRAVAGYNPTLAGATSRVDDAVVLSDGRLLLNSRLANGHELRLFTRDGTADNTWGNGSRVILGDGPIIFGRPDIIPNVDGGVYYSLGRNDQSDGDGIAGGVSYLDSRGTFKFRDLNNADYDETSDDLARLPGGAIFHTNYSYGSDRTFSMIAHPDGSFVRRDVPEVFQLEGESTAYTYRLAEAGNGRVLASGFQYLESWSQQYVLVRFNAMGQPDRTFDGDGSKIVPPDFELRFAQSDGATIYSVGRYTGIATGIRRLRPNGAPDTSFGFGGSAAAGFDRFDLDSQNRIIAWRVLRGGAADGDIQVMRLTANGKLDTTFGGGDGVVVIDTKLNSTATANVMVASDNRIIATSVQTDGQRVKWSATRLLA